MSEEMKLTHGEQVGQVYDSWNEALHAFGEQLHFGYWVNKNDQSSLQEAEDHLTDLVAEYLSPVPGSRFLDAGCGMGKPALRIASMTGVSIVGINVARKELAVATERARKLALSDRVTFQYADMTNLPFESASFDGAYAIESLFHVSERADAIREMYRVLKPGGRFVFVDPLVHNLASQKNSTEEAAWSGSFATLEYLTENLQTTGFSEIKVLDLTESMRRSIPLMQQRYTELFKTDDLRASEYADLLQAIEADRVNAENGGRYLLIASRKPLCSFP
jgi:ubiquinone/menaquinone biosynthesis C-methylase UbiE